MHKPEYLDQLIDRASEKAGSDYALAKMLDTTRQNVSNWRHGRKPCPAGDQVLMAEIAGLKAEEWASRAIVAQYEGTKKGDMLLRALGKACLATGAAIGSSGASALESFSNAIRCILLLNRLRQSESTKLYNTQGQAALFLRLQI